MAVSFIVFPIPGFTWKWYGHIVEYRPFMTSLATSMELAFASTVQAAQLDECAAIMGATRWQTLRYVTLPLVRPGIFAGGLFAVLTSLDNLPLSYFFGSATTNTPPVVMLGYMENQFDPSIAAISMVQMLIAIGALLVLDRVYGIERLTAVWSRGRWSRAPPGAVQSGVQGLSPGGILAGAPVWVDTPGQ